MEKIDGPRVKPPPPPGSPDIRITCKDRALPPLSLLLPSPALSFFVLTSCVTSEKGSLGR